MHPEPKALLRRAIQECLPMLQRLAGEHSSPHLVWTKRTEGQWHGEEERNAKRHLDVPQVVVDGCRGLSQATIAVLGVSG
jgi:hypothetical protein